MKRELIISLHAFISQDISSVGSDLWQHEIEMELGNIREHSKAEISLSLQRWFV